MCLAVILPDEAFVLNVPASAGVVIVTTDAGILGLCVAMETSTWVSLSGMATEDLEIYSVLKGLGVRL